MNKEKTSIWILLPCVWVFLKNVTLGVPFKQHFANKKYTSVCFLSAVRKKGDDKDHASALALYDYNISKWLLPSIHFPQPFLPIS